MINKEWFKEDYFAHRGLHNFQCPENTLAAIKHAVLKGYSVEFDVQITKDNHLIVLHDENLKRLCNRDINIKNSNYDDIRYLKINNSNETIPLLRDVLNEIPLKTKVLIELKSSNRNKRFVKTFLDMMENYETEFAVLSFDPRIVYILKKYPHISRGFIKRKDVTKSRIINYLLNLFPIIKIVNPDFIMHKLTDLPDKKINMLFKNGMPILSYTAQNIDVLNEMRSKYTNAVFEGFTP